VRHGAARQPGQRRRRSRRAPGAALQALIEGQATKAVGQLEEAVERQRELRRAFEAACLELELARALEAAGRGDEAQEVRARADAVLEPLGCVNPF
jgi:hypothetical protein